MPPPSPPKLVVEEKALRHLRHLDDLGTIEILVAKGGNLQRNIRREPMALRMRDTPKETVSVKLSLSLPTTRRHPWATGVKPAQKSFKYIKFYVQEQFATPKQVCKL